MSWLHVPAVAWGAVVELMGWPVPADTAGEPASRDRTRRGYTGAFVDRYLLPILYPEDLSRAAQVALGAAVLIANLLVYRYVRRQRAVRA